MIECKICNVSIKNYQSLSKHIKTFHEISSEAYYTEYVKRINECVVCSNKTNFVNINTGFKITCSRSCGAIHHRKNLKNNNTKYSLFTNKVSENVTNYHKSLTNNEKIKRLLNVSHGIQKSIKTLTPSERMLRFGWFNKLTEEEQNIFKTEIMFKTGMFKWWAEASEEEKDRVYLLRFKNYGKSTFNEDIELNMRMSNIPDSFFINMAAKFNI